MTHVPPGGRVAVTGVTGFVGPVLAELLADKGYHVVGISDVERCPDRVSHYVAEYVSCDLTTAWPDIAPVDGVVHLAGLAAVGPSFTDPQGYIEVNSSMVTRLGEALLASASTARVIVVSSGAVYGSRENPTPFTEDDSLDFPSPYVVSKVLGEHQVSYYRRRDLDVLVARPFNHIGPGQRAGFIVPDLAAKLQELAPGEPLVTGSLDGSRDYTDVRDVARAYVALLELPAPEHGVYNVASGASRTGHEVLAALCDTLGREVPETIVERARAVDPHDVRASAARLTAETGWRARIEFDASVRDFVRESARTGSPA